MDEFVKGILKDFGFDHGTSNSPSDINLFSVDNKSAMLTPSEKTFFHSSVAKLLYLSKRIRSDLLLTVSFLSTRVKEPTKDDYGKLLRCVRYLRATSELQLTLSSCEPEHIYAYIDSSYAIHNDFRSHTGMCITLGRGMFSCKSTKQRLNVKSSTEAELVGISDCLNDVLWMLNFVTDLGFPVKPITVWHDNLSVISMLTTGFTGNRRSRHINIRFYFAKDYIDKGLVIVKYKPSSEMIADVLSKPLTGRLFKEMRDKLLGI